MLGDINPNQLKKVIRKPIQGTKEGKISLEELLICNELESQQSSILQRRMVPSKQNPDIIVERVELDFHFIQQKLNFSLMKEKNAI